MPAEYYYYCKSASNTVDDHHTDKKKQKQKLRSKHIMEKIKQTKTEKQETDMYICISGKITDQKTKTEIKAHYGKD